MATLRHFLRNTQTETGTTGTPGNLGSVVDLLTTAGDTTLGSGNTQSATFVLAKRFTRTVGATLLGTSTTWATSISMSTVTTPVEWYIRLVRQNSSGTLQTNSDDGSVYTDAGTKTQSFTWAAGTWQAGDRLCVEAYIRRPSGTGNKNFTLNITDASYVDAPLLPHALTANGVVSGAPTVGEPALTQEHGLAATGIATGAPTLGTPAVEEQAGQINYELDADGVDTGAPTLGSPALTQAHTLTADGLDTGAPTLGSPAIAQVHSLLATGIVTDAPVFDEPTITQTHILAADGFDTGAPTMGEPELASVEGQHNLDADGFDAGAPTLGSPALTQTHILTADGIVTGAVTLGSPDMETQGSPDMETQGESAAITGRQSYAIGRITLGFAAVGRLYNRVARGAEEEDDSWWLAGGIDKANVIAVYQPKGAASLAASYVNLANPGTFDAAPGTAPTWAEATGWTFNGSSQYLTTGITPSSLDWSVLIDYQDFTLSADKTICGSFVASNRAFVIQRGAIAAMRAYNGNRADNAPEVATATYGIAGLIAYRNGSPEATQITAGGLVTNLQIYIGALNFSNSPLQYAAVKVKSFSIYNTVLTAQQMAAVTTAMSSI